MTKFGIVGSREYPNLERVHKYVSGLPLDAIVVSGGARGVDKTAEDAAKARGLQTIVHEADWNRHGKKAGFLRNTDIVNDSDIIIAFWDGESNGTLDSIKKAVKQNKKVVIYGI